MNVHMRFDGTRLPNAAFRDWIIGSFLVIILAVNYNLQSAPTTKKCVGTEVVASWTTSLRFRSSMIHAARA